MLKEILTQVAHNYLGDETQIFSAFLLCIAPTLIVVAIVAIAIYAYCSRKFSFTFRQALKAEKNKHYEIQRKLEEQVGQLEKDISNLTKNNAELKIDNNNYSAEIHELNNQIADKCDTIQCYDATNKNLRSNLERVTFELREAQSAIKAKNNEDASTTATIDFAEENHSNIDFCEIGRKFEKEIEHILIDGLSDWFEKDNAILLYQVKLKYDEEVKYPHIVDFLLLHKSGIYIIECKNWAGLIVGQNHWEEWIQVKCKFILDGKNPICPIFYDDMKLAHFRNPIKQVDSQKEDLEKLAKNYLGERYKKLINLRTKRVVVMNRTNGDIESAVSPKSIQAADKHLWYGYKDELIKGIKDLSVEMPSYYYFTDNQIRKLYEHISSRQESNQEYSVIYPCKQ